MFPKIGVLCYYGNVSKDLCYDIFAIIWYLEGVEGGGVAFRQIRVEAKMLKKLRNYFFNPLQINPKLFEICFLPH